MLWSMRARAVLVPVLVLAGCGSEPPRRLPPAAEPAASPPLRAMPAGRVLRVGRAPEGVAFAARGLVAVALRAPPRVAIVRAGRVVRRVPLPGAARHLAAGAASGTVLVPAETADRLLTVGASNGRVLADVGVGRSPHAAVAAAAGRVFVADERAGALSVVRGAHVERTLSTPLQPGGIAATADGRLVAVVSVRERTLTVYDAVTLRRVGSLPAGVGPTHVAIRGGDAFVADTQGGALLVFRLRPRLRFVRRANLRGGPYGMALSGDRLWVTLTARDEVVAVTADEHPRVLRRLPTVRQPNSVAARSGEVAVTGRYAGVLQLIDPSGG
jgi:DNA-binding beta-propeller fold protein YncE